MKVHLKGMLFLCIIAHSLLFYLMPAYARTILRVDIPQNCKYLLVGDSRTVGVKLVMDKDEEGVENVGYICEVGQGLTWLNRRLHLSLNYTLINSLVNLLFF